MTVKLTPDELTKIQLLTERLDGFMAGVRAMAEEIKQQAIQEVLAARNTPQQEA